MIRFIVTAILDWIAARLTAIARKHREEVARSEEIERRTKAEAEALKNAQTEDEVERAAKDVLGRS